MKKKERHREKNHWYIDSCAEIPGLVMENGSVELTESFVRELCHQDHQLVLVFSMPDDRKIVVRQPEQGIVYGGMLSFRPANAQYRVFLGSGSYKWFQLRFDPAHFPRIAGSVAAWDFQVLCNIIGSPMEASLRRMAAEVADPAASSQELLTALSEVVVVDLIRLLDVAEHKADTRGILSQRQLHRIMEYVDTNGHSPATIQNLSKLLGISPRHFTRMFKASTGQTVHSYVSQERVRRAIGMLTTTNLTAKQISTQLGYSAPWGFSAAFQKAMGETPTEFRRRFMANRNDVETAMPDIMRLADARP